MRRVVGAIVAVALGAAVAAAAPRSRVVAVDIQEFAYRPHTLTIARGAAVRWVNRDEETHTVTSSTGAFTSAGLGHNETFEERFGSSGTFEYFCALHPHMRATIVVR